MVPTLRMMMFVSLLCPHLLQGQHFPLLLLLVLARSPLQSQDLLQVLVLSLLWDLKYLGWIRLSLKNSIPSALV